MVLSTVKSASRLFIAALVIMAAISHAGAATEEEAREYFVQGKEYYDQAQYGKAIQSFKKAMQIRPSPMLDYNIARCHEKLGQPNEAIRAYERYLEATPYASNREVVKERLAELKKLERKAVPPATDRSASPAASQPASPAASQPASPAASQPASNVLVPRHEAEGFGHPTPPAAPVHEAERATPFPPPVSPQRIPSRPQQKERPIYKQWWFWAGCAGAAIIAGFIIATAASDNQSSPRPGSTAGGLQLSF